MNIFRNSKAVWFFVLLFIVTGIFIKFAYVDNCLNTGGVSWGNIVGVFHTDSSNKTLSDVVESSDTVDGDDEDETEFRFEGKFEGQTYAGKSFDKKWNKYLKELDLYNVKPTNDKEILFNSTPIIITAFSSNHFGEARTMMKHIQDFYNKTKMLYVYDLGISDKEKAEIYSTYGEIVYEIRRFPFERYPQYFQSLSEFRWKPVLIAQMLLEYPVVWYMDTSIQVRKSVQKVYEDIRKCADDMETCPAYPWQLVEATGHSILSATDPKMFDYLPMPDYFNKNLSMYAGGLELIYGLKRNKERILRYWVLCALQKDCMGPPGSQVYCSFKANRWAYYAQCHRFDQSAINILVSWATGFRENRYNHPVANDALKVVRGG